MKRTEPLIFELSQSGRGATAQYPPEARADIPAAFRRRGPLPLPEVSELQAVRHYTRLSQMNFGIDTQFYPLGSCTMKYNPRVCNSLAMLPEFLGRHPLAPASTGQGLLSCLFELQEMLRRVTGMAGVSLTPMAGAQGEFTGVAMIRAYHHARGDAARNEIIVPDAAHGTNPATATMCGMKVREIASLANGDVDLAALDAVLSPATAGIMLTNPSTLGVFERHIVEIERKVHAAGGLLYYDGANLNAILGKVRPGDMGFDVIHMNLHKTFSTPHGGGGPGSGAVGVGQRLLPYMPVPVVGRDAGIQVGVLAPDGRQGMITHAEQFARTGIPFVFDPGQAMTLFGREELETFIDQATWVTVNDYEAQLLQERTGLSTGEIAARVKAYIVTQGSEGSVVHTVHRRFDIPAVRAAQVVDPTGCGDAYRAGLIYGLARGMDWDTTGRIASLIGAIKIETVGTQHHRFTPDEFKERFHDAFDYRLD